MRSVLGSALISAVAICLCCSSAAMAGNIAIDNHGFQDPAIGVTPGYSLTLPGWTNDGGGTYGAAQQGLGGDVPTATDGDQWAFLSANTDVYQQLGTLDAGRTYHLGLKIGRRTPALGAYSIGLYSGPGTSPVTPLATIANPALPNAASYTTASLVYDSPAGNPNAGENLFIRFQNPVGAGQMLLDDVVLLTGGGMAMANPGFESPDLASIGANWTLLDVRNWSVRNDTAANNIGVVAETLDATMPVDPTGEQWLFLNGTAAGGAAVWQPVGLIEPDTDYTIDAVVGDRGYSPLKYRVGLYAGTIDDGPRVPLATVNTPIVPGLATSAPVPTVRYVPEPHNPYAGQVLYARLESLRGGSQVLFNDAVVDAAPTIRPADSIAIDNAGFEDNPLPNDGDWQVGSTGWNGVGTPGTFNPNPNSEFGVEGQIVAFSNAAGNTLSQVLGATLETGKLYVLSAKVGSQTAAARSWRVQLRAGGELLSQDLSPTVTLGPGITDTATVRFAAPAGHALLGQNLEVVLDHGVAAGGQVLFDDVRLQTMPVRVHTVVNPSFEVFTNANGDPVALGDNQYIHFANAGNSGQPEPIDITGWTQTGGGANGAGLFNPLTGYPNGEVIHGGQIMFVNDATYVSQTLGDVLEAGRVYNLSARLGATAGVPTYDVGLYAGGLLIENVTSNEGPVGVQNAFIDVSVTVDADHYPHLVGGPLEIRLAMVSTGVQTQFDQIMLTSVPEPSTLALAVLAVVALAGCVRRLRDR